MNNSYKIHIFNLLPASIKSNSKKNFYNKIKLQLRKPYLKLIFFFFCPGGQFSFCSYNDITKDNLIPRAGKPEEVAQAIIFAVENEFLTGTTIDVDGGWLTS